MECDQPYRLRGASIRDDDYLVFQTPIEKAKPSTQMDSHSLSLSIDRMRKRFGDDWLCFPAIERFIQSREREDAKFATLLVLLAAQEFQRANGEFPAAIDELVPEYLGEVPIDPKDKHGGRLRYRRDASSEAVVWSVGEDHEDNEGASLGASIDETGDFGFCIRLRSPLAFDVALPEQGTE